MYLNTIYLFTYILHLIFILCEADTLTNLILQGEKNKTEKLSRADGHCQEVSDRIQTQEIWFQSLQLIH